FKSCGTETVSFKSVDDLAVKYIKEFFPEIIKEKKFNLKNEDDALILISLLMYSTCIKLKIEEFVTKTCSIKLENNHEEILKQFFELMLKIENGLFTRKNIMNIIQQCFEPEVVPVGRASLSPSQKNCLKEFLGSPSLQEKYKKNKEVNDVRHLNQLLQEENAELLSERDLLSTKNQQLDSSVQKLQIQLSEKTQEIISLKEELKLHEDRGTTQNALNKIEKQFKEEIDQLQKELKEMQSEHEHLQNEKEKYIWLNSDLKQALKEREDELVENFKLNDQLQLKLEDLESKNKALETSVKDLNQIIEQLEEKSPLKALNISGPRVEENLGQVLCDLELKEKKVEIEQLKKKLDSLELECRQKEEEVSQHVETEKKLQDELQSKCETIDILTCTLNELRDQLKVCEKELQDQTNIAKDLRTKSETTERDLLAIQAKYNELEVQLADSLKIATQLNCEIANKDEKIEQMKMSMETLTEENNDCQMKNTEQVRIFIQFTVVVTGLVGFYRYRYRWILDLDLDFLVSRPTYYRCIDYRFNLPRIYIVEGPRVCLSLWTIVGRPIRTKKLEECEEKYSDLSSLVDEYDGNGKDSEGQRLIARLGHLTQRIDRIPLNETNKEEFEDKLVELLAKSKKLLDLVTSKEDKSNVDPSSEEEDREKEESVSMTTTPSYSSSQNKTKSVPVYKWGLRFNNEQEQSVAAFLQRVEELRRARGVSHQELFDSAVDLFAGPALKEEKDGKKKERRPFDRNIDLQVHRFDEAQKKAIFKKAQLLDTRFSTGESKFL
ncbi:myosin-11-like, partial [Macrosteles quadrilineatus]|uniref:myosin-11-like n=1 Tax=Macrosteles quadrilineatus TaxID=74068 RepID=UPI0023E0FF59